MPEQEDFNTFSSADCGGAMFMLGIAPAVMAYVFADNVVLAIIFGVAAVVLAAAVYILSLITRWRFIPPIVDLLGIILTPAYVVVAIWLWWQA